MRPLMIVLLALVVTCLAAAQTQPDSVLLSEIQKIKAIDNHTHVLKVTGPGEQDTDYDGQAVWVLVPPRRELARDAHPLRS